MEFNSKKSQLCGRFCTGIASILFFCFWCLLKSGIAWADAKQDVKKLVRLRTEVDNLEGQLENRRLAADAEVASLRAQKQQLTLMMQQEQVRHTVFVALKEKSEGDQEREQTWIEHYSQIARDAAAALHRTIQLSLPFKREERLAQIDEIRRDLEEQQVDPVAALSRLWQIVEDEVALTKQVGVSRQIIRIGTEKRLVETARLGMAVLYFRDDRGQVGWAKPEPNGNYVFEHVQSDADADIIRNLFDTLIRQLGVGYVEVLLPPGGIRHATGQ